MNADHDSDSVQNHAAGGTASSDMPSGGQDPIINYQELLNRCMGKTELVKKILGRFQETMPLRIEEIQASCTQGDPEQIRALGHAIKGVAANISAESFRAAAERMEHAAKSGGQDVQNALSVLLDEYNRCVQYIGELLNQSQETETLAN